MKVDRNPHVVMTTTDVKVTHEVITLTVNLEERIKLLRILQVIMDLNIDERRKIGLFVDHGILARELYQGLIR